MKLLILLSLLTGCASTQIITKDFTLRTQANVKGLVVNPGGFSIASLDHSGPTLAGGKAISSGTAAFGTALTGLGTALLVH